MNTLIVYAVVGALALGGAYMKGRSDVHALWDAEKVKSLTELNSAYKQALDAKRETEDRIAAAKEKESANLSAVDRRHRAALERLRQQQANASGSGVSNDSAAQCSAATEGTMAREDGAVALLGYAADAARLQVAYDQCVSQYETVRETMNGKH